MRQRGRSLCESAMFTREIHGTASLSVLMKGNNLKVFFPLNAEISVLVASASRKCAVQKLTLKILHGVENLVAITNNC